MVELSDNQKVQPTFLYFWRVELFDYQKVQPINSMSYCHNVISIWVELSDNQIVQLHSWTFRLSESSTHVWLNFLKVELFDIPQYVSMSIWQYVGMQLFSLGVKMKVVQNVILFKMSWGCQTFQLRYQNESCSECHQDVGQSLCYVNISICQYVNVRRQLFSLVIKMKVVQNVIMMSDSQKTSTNRLSGCKVEKLSGCHVWSLGYGTCWTTFVFMSML